MMSRRAKRKNAAAKSSKNSPQWSRWLIRFIVTGMILAAVASVGGYMWLGSYLNSADFRKLILTEAKKTLRAEATMSPLRWDGFQVNAESFEASSLTGLKHLSLEGVRTGVDAAGVFRGVWSVSPSRATRLSATWDTTALANDFELPMVEPTTAAPQKKWYDSWIPKKIETDSLTINDSIFRLITKDGEASLSGTRWDVEPSDSIENYKLRATSGKVKLPQSYAPELKLDQMRLTYRKGFIFVTNSAFRMYENGHLEMAGELDLKSQSYSIEGSARDVMCHEVLPADWRQRLTGRAQTSFMMRSSGSSSTIKGKLIIEQGNLTALPILDKLAAYSQSLRFRSLSLHTAECDYELSDNRIELSNIKVGSEGLVRMEGKLIFSRPSAEQPYQLDGDFQLGLAPGTLATIPGAEEDVFLPGERGLRWAKMRVTGTIDEPKEDLTDRLMAAAGARMFDIIPATGQKVLKFTQQVVEEGAVGNGVVDKAVNISGKAIETGKGVVDQAVQGTTGAIGGVLGGLLGIPRTLQTQEPEQSPDKEEIEVEKSRPLAPPRAQ